MLLAIVFGAALAQGVAGCAQKTLPPAAAPSVLADGRRCPDIYQGWDCQTLRQFWFEDQGSKLMPYRWFAHLERADARTPFKDSLPQYGFLKDPNPEFDNLNPDRLPVGVVNHRNDKKDHKDWLGLTCAACHTTRVDHGQQQFFVEGGPNLLDFDSFFADTVAALRSTLDNRDGRFDQLKAALDKEGTPTADLLVSLKAQTEYLEHRARINATPLHGGYGRVDAFGQIFNQMLVMWLHNPDSTAVPASAPVSFPFLWDVAQHDVVQWNGSAPNLGVEGPGSVLRNIGEVLGVFGELYDLGTPDNYDSSAMVPNLRRIESWLVTLRAPKWPWPSDDSAALRGKKIYQQEGCQKCHAVIGQPEYPLPITMTPIDDVQTDSHMIDQFITRRSNMHQLQGRAVGVSRNPFKHFAEVDEARHVAGHLSAGALNAAEHPSGLDKLKGFWKLLLLGGQDFSTYKARPLDGIWATAPFLHNGSVPSLQQLLMPPDNRVPTFCVGSRQYDPVNVGYSTACGPGTSTFDTTLHGNGNIGHAYGTALSPDQKRDLVEYLKGL